MYIAFATPHRGFQGGVERYAYDLARDLKSRGHRTALLYGSDEGKDKQVYSAAFDLCDHVANAHLHRKEFDVIYVQRASCIQDLEPFADRPLLVASHDHDLTCVRSHRYLPRSHKPCHRPPGKSCVAYGCVIVRNRTSGQLPIRLRNPFALRSQVRELAQRAPLAACSEYVANNLRKAGVPSGRVHVLRPTPPENSSDVAPEPATLNLVAVARLLRGKGIDLVIQALEHLPSSTQLSVVGDGPSLQELQNIAAQVAPGRVRFDGYVPPERIDLHYDAASIAVVPSRWPEPFGMVGVEAMRRARPVVAAAHGGIPEWLKPESGGELFEPGSPRSLARAVERVRAKKGAGEQARLYVQQEFSREVFVDAAEALLERVAQGLA